MMTDDNPYRAPAEPADPVVRRRSPLKTLNRCWLLYFAAFTGATIGNVIGHTPVSPLWHRDAMVVGGLLGLAVAVVWLLTDDAHKRR